MNFKDKIKDLKPYDLNCNVFDVYSYNGLSMQELLCQFFHKINDCIKISNDTIDLASWLVNEGLSMEVANKLTLWLEDGTLENIINVNLFNSLNTKIDDLNSQLNTEIDNLNSQLNTEIDNLNSQLAHITHLNIRQFEKYNDENDDTGRFKRAIEQLENEGGTLYIPNGNYRISDTIILPSNIQLEGEIKSDNNNDDLTRNSTILWTGGDKPLFTTIGFESPHTTSNKINIKKLFICDRAVVSRTNYFVVDLFNCSYSNITDCCFDTINNPCMINNNTKNGVAFRKTSSYTDNSFVNRFVDNKLQGGQLYIDSTDSFVQNNLLWGTIDGIYQTKCALEMNKSYNTFVNNNEIVGKMILSNCDGNIISQNYFDAGFIERLTDELIICDDTLSNCVISNNNFWHGRKQALKINVLTGCVITSNVFSNNDFYDRGYNDIDITKIESSNISNNSFVRKMHIDMNTLTSVTNNRKNLGMAINILKDSSDYWSQSVISGNSLILTDQYIESNFPNSVLSVSNGHKYLNKIMTDISQSPKNIGLIGKTNNDNVYIASGNTGSDWTRITEMKLQSSSTDFNSMNLQGSYYYTNVQNIEGKPSDVVSGNAILEIYQLNGNYLMQRLTMLSTMTIYVRYKENGIFKQWYKTELTSL